LSTTHPGGGFGTAALALARAGSALAEVAASTSSLAGFRGGRISASVRRTSPGINTAAHVSIATVRRETPPTPSAAALRRVSLGSAEDFAAGVSLGSAEDFGAGVSLGSVEGFGAGVSRGGVSRGTGSGASALARALGGGGALDDGPAGLSS
jgi:hypothetical protein